MAFKKERSAYQFSNQLGEWPNLFLGEIFEDKRVVFDSQADKEASYTLRTNLRTDE